MNGRRHPQADHRPLVSRPTALTVALVEALARDKGIDASNARTPLKREPTWRVTRKAR